MSFASTSTAESEPPFYVLLQNASGATQTTAGSASTFVHPTIEYHFADDPPSALLPASDEVVVIIDYNGPDLPPMVQSLHPDLAVTGIKIADAPGAAAAHPRRNDKMYVLETVSCGDNVYAGSQFFLLCFSFLNY